MFGKPKPVVYINLDEALRIGRERLQAKAAELLEKHGAWNDEAVSEFRLYANFKFLVDMSREKLPPGTMYYMVYSGKDPDFTLSISVPVKP